MSCCQSDFTALANQQGKNLTTRAANRRRLRSDGVETKATAWVFVLVPPPPSFHPTDRVVTTVLLTPPGALRLRLVVAAGDLQQDPAVLRLMCPPPPQHVIKIPVAPARFKRGHRGLLTRQEGIYLPGILNPAIILARLGGLMRPRAQETHL